jgi:transcription initiation factor IIE alpha subunit
MEFKCYKNRSNYFAHCEKCAKKLENDELIMIDRHIFYCSKCGNELRNERISKLEARISRWKKL